MTRFVGPFIIVVAVIVWAKSSATAGDISPADRQGIAAAVLAHAGLSAPRVRVHPADREAAAPPDTLSVAMVAHGDLTGDDREEAAVLVGCREDGANYEIHEVIAYTSAAAGVRPMGSLGERQMRQDYVRSA